MKRYLLLLPSISLLAADDRGADREAIRAHIDRIFQAFIHKDAADLRATHAANWLGYLEGSETMIRGVDGYMETSVHFDPGNPYGMKAYKMREFDVIFQGDAAFACFVADVDSNTPSGVSTRALRICDFYTKPDGRWIQTGSYTDLHPESATRQYQMARTLSENSKKKLLEAREAVWRSYFGGDRATLEKLIPADLTVIGPAGTRFGNRDSALEGSAAFAKNGKLVRLEFPQTEVQCYGYTAIVYSTYSYELEVNGQRSTHTGRVTETFVYRDGKWVNPGWHMDESR
jgi:hypothetical protein